MKKWISGMAVISCVCFLSACNSTSKPKDAVKPEKTTYTIGYFNSTGEQQDDVKIAKQFSDAFKKESGFDVTFELAMSYDDLDQKIRKGDVDIAFNGALPLVEAEKEIAIEPILKATTHGQPFYRTEVLVKKDSPINSLDDLVKKEKAIWAYADDSSTSGYLFPYGMLKEKGIQNPKTFFTPVLAGGHDKAILAVVNGNADFATVAEGVSRSMLGKYPTLLDDTKVIAYSEKIPGQTILVKKDLPKDVKTALVSFMTSKDEETEKIVKEMFEMEAFLPAKNSEYDIVRKTYELLPK